MSYSQKTIQNLKPEWYLKLSKKEKIKRQDELIKLRRELWEKKPDKIPYKTIVTSKKTTPSVTKGKKYTVRGYFATLVTTIYESSWNEFITLKNDNGYTVKMNLRNFET